LPENINSGKKDNMKIIKRFAVLLVIVAVFSNFSIVASAEMYNFLEGYYVENNEAPGNSSINNTNAVILPVCFSDGDMLGSTGWRSLSAAQAYYGMDYSYYYCGGGGSPYNYYYCFDDGTKMFFGVWP